MALTIERLLLDDPLIFNEQLGDPVSDFGGTPVPAPRMALRHSVSIPTFPPAGTALGPTSAQLVRRQMRSLLNNTPYKLQGFYWVWTADPEQNGWYVPDMGQLADGAGDGTGLSAGFWKLENVVWRSQAKRRTHRRAAAVTMLPIASLLNGNLRWRDYRRTVYSFDFAQVTPLAVTYFPPGATDLVNSSSGAAVAATALAAGADGGAVVAATGLANLATVSFEQPEASQTKGGVICYDRNGFVAGSEETTGWSEVYGPDWPWYWPNTSTGTPDTPVLENGYCRVRFDNGIGTGEQSTPLNCGIGWRIDAWSGSAWVEVCKVWVQRYNSGLATPLALADSTLQSAGLEEYTPERAVMKCVLSDGAQDASSRETVFITLQRGWSAPRFEVYPGPTATATPLAAGAWLCVTPAQTDADDGVHAILGGPTSKAVNVSSAQGGHTGLITAQVLDGTGSSLSDNGFALVSAAAANGAAGLATGYQISAGVVQAGATVEVGATTNAYGVARNTLLVRSPNTAGYVSAQLALFAVAPEQAYEVESMVLQSGTSSTADATASNSLAATATRTSDANHAGIAGGSSHAGVYRVFARCRTTAGTMSIYMLTSLTTGATVTTTSSSYVWLDLGDVTTALHGLMMLHTWTSSGTLYVDRIEMYMRQDRIAPSPSYAGSQDIGQAVMYDSEQLGVQVSRA